MEVTIKKKRIGNDLRMTVTLIDNGVRVSWHSVSDIFAYLYSDEQRVMAGQCRTVIDESDEYKLIVIYGVNEAQYLGVNRLVMTCEYSGKTATYDAPVIDFVSTLAEEGTEVVETVQVALTVQEVSTSLLDEVIAAAIHQTKVMQDLEDEVSEAESERAAAEDIRVASEGVRVEAEAGRVEAETARTGAETARQLKEAQREVSEGERVIAEDGRTDAEVERAAAELERDQAETERSAAETARATAEAERVANETSRGSAESARVTSEDERRSYETARRSQETIRKNNESTRESNESERMSNEEQRVQNEISRQQTEAARQATFTQNEAQRTATAAQSEAARSETFTANESARQSAFEAAEAAREADYQENVVEDYQENVKGEVMHLSSNIDRANKTLGPYDDINNIVLTPTATNTCINKAGQRVTKAGWAIAEFQAVKGNEYLFKVGTMDGDVCIFSEKITKQEVRNIDYSYTYNSDGTIATASATYNGQTHTYTYVYEKDEEGRIVSETITDNQTGEVVNALPYQYRTSVGTYQPMTILNASAQLPKDAKCRLVSHFQNDTNLTVVVSYNMADADLNMEVIRDGFTASVCTQLSNLAKRISNATEYIVVLEDMVASHESEITEILPTIYEDDTNSLGTLCGQPRILFGAGTPQEAIVPDNWIGLEDGGYAWNGEPSAIGQEYINVNVSSGGRYIAVRQSYDKLNANYYNLKWINC